MLNNSIVRAVVPAERQKEKYRLLVSSCGEGQGLIFYETNREDHRQKRKYRYLGGCYGGIRKRAEVV